MQRSLVCVDASIIISLITSEAQSQKALNLWTKPINDLMVLPDLFLLSAREILKNERNRKQHRHF